MSVSVFFSKIPDGSFISVISRWGHPCSDAIFELLWWLVGGCGGQELTPTPLGKSTDTGEGERSSSWFGKEIF